MARPMPASPQKSSSIAIGMPRPDSSKDWVAKKSIEYSPIFAASWMTSQGISSRSSYSCAAGRTTSSANVVHPLLQLDLVLGEFERHGHQCFSLAGADRPDHVLGAARRVADGDVPAAARLRPSTA